MTTNRIGVKFLIAAATAGALIAGSAPGAIAAPPVAKPGKKTTPTVVLKSVDIKGHSALDFYAATPPTLKVTARVKDAGRALKANALTVTLAEYTKKVGGQRVDPGVSVEVRLGKWKGGTSKYASGSVTFDDAQVTAFKARLTAAQKPLLLCLSNVGSLGNTTVTPSTKMEKRLDNGGVISVGDCVSLVYKAPMPTTPPPSDSSIPPANTPPITTTAPTTTTPPAGSTTPPTTTPPAGSTTPTTTTPGKSAIVLVKPINRGNKLYVNVNPNKGKGYWKFQVQRKKSNGTWKSLSTYRTKGKKETRTLDLKKGTYQVVVRPKYGYLGATSLEVTLKK